MSEMNFAAFASAMNPATAKQCPAFFHEKNVVNKAKTAAEGFLVEESVEFITIHIAGGKSIVDRIATDQDKVNYAHQYAQFKAKQEQREAGIPLKACPAFDMATITMLEGKKVFTLERLAEYPDSALPSLGMRAVTLKKQAQDFMKIAKDMAIVARQEQELEKRDEEVEKLHKQTRILSARLDELLSKEAKKKKPGPKPKKVNEELSEDDAT